MSYSSKRRKSQAGIVGIAAAVGLLVGGAWTVYVSRLLTPYLGPAFSAAATELSQALGKGHGNRALFKNAAGGGSPDWVIALILAAAIGWCVLLVPSLFSVIFKRSVRGGALRYLPAAIAALYPISLLADVSSASKTVADRATTFIFFGVALVVGAWLARRIVTEPSDDRAGRHDRRGDRHLPGKPDLRLRPARESPTRALCRRRRQPVLRLPFIGPGALGRHPPPGRFSRCCRQRQWRPAQRQRRRRCRDVSSRAAQSGAALLRPFAQPL